MPSFFAHVSHAYWLSLFANFVRLAFLVAITTITLSFKSNATEDQRIWKSAPIIGSPKDNIRNKSLVFGSIGFTYSQNQSMSPNSISVLSNEYRDTGLFNDNGFYANNKSQQGQNPPFNSSPVNIGFFADIGLNITSTIWIRILTDNSWGMPNITSVTPQLYNVNAVVGYDFLSFGRLDLSLYGGFAYKSLLYGVMPIDGGYSPFSFAKIGALYDYSFDIPGAVLGFQQKFYFSDSVIFSAFEELFMGSAIGKNSAQTTGLVVAVNSPSDALLSSGFAIGASAEIAVAGGFYIKPFLKHQMTALINGTTVATSVSAITMTNSSYTEEQTIKADVFLGNSYFWSTTFGVGISWN